MEISRLADYQDHCRAWRSAALTLSNGWNTIYWDSESFDSNDMFDPAGLNYRITVKTPGVYVVSASLWIKKNGNGIRLFHIMRTGLTFLKIHAVPSAVHHTYLAGNIIVTAEVGDYFHTQAFQDTGGDLDLEIGGERANWLAAVRVGAC